MNNGAIDPLLRQVPHSRERVPPARGERPHRDGEDGERLLHHGRDPGALLRHRPASIGVPLQALPHPQHLGLRIAVQHSEVRPQQSSIR